MARMTGTQGDIVSFIKEQHERVKAMFEDVIASRGEARAKAFYALRRMLAVHETAEEEIVHPAARRLLNGEAIVEARLREEREAKTALIALETLDVDSPAFDAKIRTLRANVIAHAEAEERLELQRLGDVVEPERLQRMRRAAELAESIAPTRPHAGVESAAGNILAGPFVSMVDRARDAITGHHR